MPNVTVLYYEVGKEPELVAVENKLEEFQRLVGGDIEAFGLDDNVTLICNEEGKIHGLPLNRVAYRSTHYEPIAGNFFVTRIDADGEFADMSPAQIARAKRSVLHA